MSQDCFDWLGLNDRVVIVTGAAGGIGRAIAQAFSLAGSRVALLDRDGDACKSAAKAIGVSALAVACDVTDLDAILAAKQVIQRELGPCDILVNNAGILRPGELAEVSPREWEQVLSINLSAYLQCTRIFGAVMRERGAGALVHIASMSGSHPQPFSGAYSPSKAAVLMMSRQLAFEWGPNGVRSNTVSPGMIRTAMSEEFYRDPELKKLRDTSCPLRRVGTPADIADAVLFLASPRASYINGADLLVDGGYVQTALSHIPRPGFGS